MVRSIPFLTVILAAIQLRAYNFDASGRLTIPPEERLKLQHEKIVLQMRTDYDRLRDEWECGLNQRKEAMSEAKHWIQLVPIAMLVKVGLQFWHEELAFEDVAALFLAEGAVWAASKVPSFATEENDQKALCADQRACKKLLNRFKKNLIQAKLDLSVNGVPLIEEERNLVSSMEEAVKVFDGKIKACELLNSLEKPKALS
ncbi:MAG TPA: hypothetical protein VHO47_03685 [Candidatus Babeliales bacterium]|nr:hypothetical protein [Candidatus Babeliales bacterium]